jgi:serine/threonine protein kinase
MENNSKNGGNKFISQGRLGEIVNERDVKDQLDKYDKKKSKKKSKKVWKLLQILGPSPPPKADNLKDATKICGDPSFKRIMAILVLIDRPTKIRSFLEHQVSDDKLPFDREDANDNECFNGWSRLTTSRFLECQGAVIPFFFRQIDKTNRKPIRITQHILPFLSFNKYRHSGGSSEIYRVNIHAEQHNFQNSVCSPSPMQDNLKLNPGPWTLQPDGGRFIVKQLRGDSRRDIFKREFAVIRRFSNNAHPHIVSLLVAYEWNDSYHFIFPEARSTLAEFWKSPDIFPLTEEGDVLLWMVEQCRGLAAGLCQLHRHETESGKSLLEPESGLRPQNSRMHGRMKLIYGWHGDIKPENILWFPGSGTNMGTLKIADFGIAQFSTNLQSSRESLGFSPTYSAPEFSSSTSSLTNALCDVWALGCVYLEALAWAIGGCKLHGHLIRIKKVPDPAWFSLSSDEILVTDAFFISPRNTHGEKETPCVKPSVTEVCSSCPVALLERRSLT